MSVRIYCNPSAADILYVMERLRPMDHIEADAMHWSSDPAEWALTLAAAGQFNWAAYLDSRPVAVFGAMPRWAGTWNGWCLGTHEFPKVALSVTRHAKRVLWPAACTAGLHRGDVFVYDGYDRARAWLEVLGARPEATLEKWGKNGETFLSYVWLRENTDTDAVAHRPRTQRVPDGPDLVRAAD